MVKKMLLFDDNHLLQKECLHFERFQENLSIYKKENIEVLRDFLSLLSKGRKSVNGNETGDRKTIEMLIRLKNSGQCESDFFLNIMWLYQWLLADGFQYFPANTTADYFSFLEELTVPVFVWKRIKWGYPLASKETEPQKIKNFWNDNVLENFEKRFDINSRFSEVIDLWLLYHIGLRQLFKDGDKCISNTLETVLTKYMGLVNEYNELEQIFGFAIEQDIFRIYRPISISRKDK